MTKKIGRNQPCPCGSDKKYKHCCMRRGQTKRLQQVYKAQAQSVMPFPASVGEVWAMRQPIPQED